MPKEHQFKIRPVYKFEASPETDVAHCGHIRFTQVGTDIYMDVGIIPADILLQAVSEEKEAAPVEFRVLKRYAMSVNTSPP